MPDQIRKRSVYGQLWPLRPGWGRSDFLHQIQCCSSKDDPDHIVQNRPGSDLDGMVRFWPKGCSPESSQCARITVPSFDKTQSAHYQFPTFRIGCHRVDSLGHIVQNQPGSDLVLADCVRFWLENLIQKQAGVQESLGLLLASGSKLTQIGCKMDLACLLGKCHHENFHTAPFRSSVLLDKRFKLPLESCT